MNEQEEMRHIFMWLGESLVAAKALKEIDVKYARGYSLLVEAKQTILNTHNDRLLRGLVD